MVPGPAGSGWDTAGVGRDGSPGIVGRQAEREALRGVVARGLAGTPSLAVVVGEPGIGKSTLAAQLAAEVRADGVRVVYGSADEHDRSAYGLWREPWARLASASALIDPALPTEEQRWEVLTRLSEVLAGGPPVLLVLEDVHWADDLSLWVLARLLPGQAGQSLAALATCRARGAAPVVELVRPTEVVDLAGLDASEVAELVAELHQGNAPDLDNAIDPADLVDRTGGNPLLIRGSSARLGPGCRRASARSSSTRYVPCQTTRSSSSAAWRSTGRMYRCPCWRRSST